MWGICFDVSVLGGALCQNVVEYETINDGDTALIINPVKDIEIPIEKILVLDKPPEFVYGDLAIPVAHSELVGKIEKIIWHFKKETCGYYISVNGRKKKTRYYADDLKKLEITKLESLFQELDNIERYNIYDYNIDVIFELSDGSCWSATFFTYENLLSLRKRYQETGECLAGKYFYADKPIFISKIDKELIKDVIKDILYKGGTDAFTKLEA